MRRQTIVIFGKEGSGKRDKAIQIAEAYGSRLIVPGVVSEPFGLSFWVAGKPVTLIIEEVVFSELFFSKLKQLVTAEKYGVNLKYKTPYVVDNPSYIICTTNKEFACSTEASRHFSVIRL